MSKLKVAALQGLSASSDAITLANDGTCTANLTNRTNRRLTINGAMLVAQRGTSFTASGSFPVDRFEVGHSGTDEAPTIAQADVASGTTPYTLGFRKCYKITNGNQTGGAASSDEIHISHKIEAQDLANSGWSYTSSSSFITLSFWVKSSVAQEFHGFLYVPDGSAQLYSFSLGSLSADTWTKVTKTIPGNSNLTFNNDNGEGMNIRIACYKGSSTGSITQNQWAAFNTNLRYPTYTSTWYTTNDATFEITGVQLEVGDHATDFEHRSFAQELALCHRYCYVIPVTSNDFLGNTSCYAHSTTNIKGVFHFPQVMRTYPTYTGTNTAARGRAGNTSNNFDLDDISGGLGDSTNPNPRAYGFTVTTSSMTGGQAVLLEGQASGSITFDAEL